MFQVLPLLVALAMALSATWFYSEGLRHQRSAIEAVRTHHFDRYRLHYCGAYLAAKANIAIAVTKLRADGAPLAIEDKAQAYIARLGERLAIIGQTETSCQQLSFGGYRLALYDQNPAQPSHWPNVYYRLEAKATDHEEDDG